jgi:predicted nucleic acid-binding protein
MIVVADTSPLNYLIQIEHDSLLPKLYRTVIVPEGVIAELKSSKAPQRVKSWCEHLPNWIDVYPSPAPPDAELSYLGRGEREAIQLAEGLNDSLLLIDERKGRTEALRRGLYTTGTLGVLLAAGEAGLVDPRNAYRRLVAETTFRTSPTLEASFLSRFIPE